MNKNNFYIATKADWTLVKSLEFEEAYAMMDNFDFRSSSASCYKYTEAGVYRISDHFGKVASCSWTLDGQSYESHRFVLAFCKWENFERKVTDFCGSIGYWHNNQFIKIG